ncbi:cysteine desulfurase/selenocysteine lyase [Rhodovulum iodosum]|uniref:Cysteine desulfurase/selenocysteine lyase n=1 Tax=Rhodovulum iodosum TaxID=68291 RepID=A0ABV3XUX1_9RHOB|nr:aminotransferase class V-fold PLP-dependent enzyme [Rhodovulum robiginosum]RSK40784.1 aminotransferase class V-fold PLP-dependent enzyme [Rhodovulum robiginosum]
MFDTVPGLLDAIRSRFAHVETCPFQGERVFFENAGGALTLNSVVETSARFAAIPDNQGRDNTASHALAEVIGKARADMAVFFNAPGGQFIVGESGTELLFRLIGAASLGTGPGRVLGSTLEHPASRSAAARYAPLSDKAHVLVAHDDATGTVDAAAYLPEITPDTRVATILHTSPVTGIGVDVAAIAAAIRKVAPECYIVVDGIQHAAHGRIDLAAYGIDGYVVSPYKAFSRHGYGVAWLSDRLAALPHDGLMGAPGGAPWELGTRDTGAYATFSDVVAYLDWLGGQVSDHDDRRARIVAAGAAIHAHEQRLTEAMLHGTGNLPGLAQIEGVTVIGGVENAAREGLVSFALDGRPAPELVAALNAAGVRTHTRKDDHYSGNILTPLGLETCVRVSLCHYNTEAEVARLLAAMQDIVQG